jgi:predicted transcriptional regulator
MLESRFAVLGSRYLFEEYGCPKLPNRLHLDREILNIIEYNRICEVIMAKVVTLRLDDATYAELREAAEAERRPLSNLIETSALIKIREQQFVDDAEMAEILGNEKILKRLRAGSRDAKRRRGRFVE